MMTTGELRFGSDVDDVLLRTADCTIELYNAQYGTALTLDNWYDFDPMTPWGAEALSEASGRVIGIMGSDGFVESVEPLEGAIETLRELDAAGILDVAITGRPEAVRTHTEAAVRKHYGNQFAGDRLYFTDHFNHMDGHKKITKVDVALEHKLTHYAEDQLEHAIPLAEAGLTVFLLDDNGRYRWNRNSDLPPNIIRVPGWLAIRQYFYGLGAIR